MKNKRVTYKWTGVAAVPVAMFIDTEPYPRGTVALSEVSRGMTEASFTNIVAPFVAMANAPGMVIDTPAGPMLAIEQPAKWARHSFETFLRAQGVSLKPIRGRGGYAVSHPAGTARFSRMCSASRQFLEALRKFGLFEGQVFGDLDGLHLLPDADKLAITSRGRQPKGRHRHDTGCFYRFAADAAILRTDAVFCADAITAALADAPLFVRLCVSLCRNHALRARREAVGLTAYGLHKGGGFERPRAFAFNKGDRDEPTKRFEMTPDEWAQMKLLFDGERRALDPQGRGWDDFRELSRRAGLGDLAAERELRVSPVFLVRDGKPLTYHNLYKTYVRPRLKAAGIRARLHMLRHEFVYVRLREIEAMAIPQRERDRKKARLAVTMGWASQAMYRVYDAFEQERRRIEEEIEYQRRLADGIAAAQCLASAPDDRPQAAPLPERMSAARRRFMSLGMVVNG